MKIDLIINELELIASNLNINEYNNFLNAFISGINNSKIIGLASGRMGYSLRAFIMRLSHMGFNATMIGDTNVPNICSNTKIILSSSSGETESLNLFAHKAKDHGAKIYLITCSPDSRIGKISDYILTYKNINSSQIMKSAYEQFTFLLFDSLALDLADKKNIGNEVMKKNHSVLE